MALTARAPLVVAHLCDRRDPALGGSFAVARSLVDAQRAIGIDARILYLYPAHDVNRKSFAGRDLHDFESCCDIPRSRRWATGLLTLQRALGRMGTRIVHHHDSPLWSRLARVPGGAVHVEHAHLRCPSGRVPSVSWLLRQVVRMSAHRIIAVSNDVASSWKLAGFPREHIRVIPNAVDASRFRPLDQAARTAVRAKFGLPTGVPVVLWAGRLDRRDKGLDRLLAVASQVPSGPAIAIAGSGRDSAWLAEAANSLPLRLRPLLLGGVDDLAPLYAACDAFLFTSREETFGLVLVEAAAAGLPIFALECKGGGAETLRDLGAKVFKDGEERLLAEAIAEVRPATPRSDRDVICNRYSWDRSARACAECYLEVLRSIRSPLRSSNP